VLSSLVVKEMVLGLHHPRTALIVKVPTVHLISSGRFTLTGSSR
jgi:hypothetical protein